MPRQSDPRYMQSEQAICDALARLLEKKPLASISMSELAREAGVSRCTLYAHHDNVSEAYEQTVRMFYERTETFDEHFLCASCQVRKTAMPYCERLREAGPYASVVNDDRFLPATIRTVVEQDFHSIKRRLQDVGVPADLAHVICLFQMSGCYSAATSVHADGEEWKRYQEVIDRFVRGGMAALGVEL